jgi:hypothetical protein
MLAKPGVGSAAGAPTSKGWAAPTLVIATALASNDINAELILLMHGS